MKQRLFTSHKGFGKANSVAQNPDADDGPGVGFGMLPEQRAYSSSDYYSFTKSIVRPRSQDQGEHRSLSQTLK